VWFSYSVRVSLFKHATQESRRPYFLDKLEYWASAGFDNFEGTERSPIRYEWDGVYRIGLHGDLFRVYGFYVGPRKRCFVAVIAFGKRGRKLRTSEIDRINDVARVKREKAWRKRGV
jgi:hypothetical protein